MPYYLIPFSKKGQNEQIKEAGVERFNHNINTSKNYHKEICTTHNFEDRITLYYPTTAPVVQGSIVAYGNKLYILVNRETEENDCYYKSSGLACNGMITLNDGMVVGVPCYAYNIFNYL